MEVLDVFKRPHRGLGSLWNSWQTRRTTKKRGSMWGKQHLTIGAYMSPCYFSVCITSIRSGVHQCTYCPPPMCEYSMVPPNEHGHSLSPCALKSIYYGAAASSSTFRALPSDFFWTYFNSVGGWFYLCVFLLGFIWLVFMLPFLVFYVLS